MRVKMCSVVVDDPVAAFETYTKVLGFQELMFVPEARLAIVVSPEDPGGTALLLEPNDHPISQRFQQDVREANLPVIVFGVEDCAAEVERLRAQGVTIHAEPSTSEHGTSAVIEDGCGNLVQLHQDAAPA